MMELRQSEQNAGVLAAPSAKCFSNKLRTFSAWASMAAVAFSLVSCEPGKQGHAGGGRAIDAIAGSYDIEKLSNCALEERMKVVVAALQEYVDPGKPSHVRTHTKDQDLYLGYIKAALQVPDKVGVALDVSVPECRNGHAVVSGLLCDKSGKARARAQFVYSSSAKTARMLDWAEFQRCEAEEFLSARLREVIWDHRGMLQQLGIENRALHPVDHELLRKDLTRALFGDAPPGELEMLVSPETSEAKEPAPRDILLRCGKKRLLKLSFEFFPDGSGSRWTPRYISDPRPMVEALRRQEPPPPAPRPNRSSDGDEAIA